MNLQEKVRLNELYGKTLTHNSTKAMITPADAYPRTGVPVAELEFLNDRFDEPTPISGDMKAVRN